MQNPSKPVNIKWCRK